MLGIAAAGIGDSQRGWNAQPGGSALRFGGAPGIAASCCRALPRRAAAASAAAPWCRACGRGRTATPPAAASTTSPAYITMRAVSDLADTTPRLWVMKIIAMPVCAAACAFSSSRICAWIVTSSAVVGSSAIRMLRVAGQRDRDHHALAHAAGELVRIAREALLADRRCRARPAGRAPRARAARASERADAAGALR